MLIEHYTFREAMYMTTLAITTVGFGEVRPLSDSGQIFTTFLLIISWVALAFVLGSITQFVVNGEIKNFFKHYRMTMKINNLKNHVVLCGFGRNGQQAAKTFIAHKIPFVVIDKNEKIVEKFKEEYPDIIFLCGDATEDECLLKANIMHAKALLTALPNDSENVFIVLSARALHNKLRIISRASDNNTIQKLKKAGADNVIMPDKIGGTHMATLVSKPDVIEFIDFLSGEEGESIHIESLEYNQLPKEVKNQTLEEIMNWKKTGVNSIGIKDADGKFIINPPSNTLLTDGMKLIVLGNREQIDAMKINLES
jgi:voltage-gated potassium channel